MRSDSQEQLRTSFSLATKSYYPLLLAGFITLLVITNVVAVKLISVGPLTVDGGVFLFPLVYIFGDVLAEVYGFKAARRAIIMGFVMSLVATFTIVIVQLSPPAPDWPNQEAFQTILGFVPRIVAASLIAYVIGQLTNAWVMVKLRDRSTQRTGILSKLWFRLVGSTALGQLLDTMVFCFIAFYGMLLGWSFWGYVALGYLIKVSAEVVLLPITTRVIRLVRKHENSLLKTHFHSNAL